MKTNKCAAHARLKSVAANRSAPCSLRDGSNESQARFFFFCSLTILHKVIALQPSEAPISHLYYSAQRAVLHQQKALQFVVKLSISKNNFYQQHTRKCNFLNFSCSIITVYRPMIKKNEVANKAKIRLLLTFAYENKHGCFSMHVKCYFLFVHEVRPKNLDSNLRKISVLLT